MVSIREQALGALFTKLNTALSTSDRTIVRNEEEPQKIPTNGFIILRDGEQGEPESITLSPVRYAYEHIAEVSVLIRNISTSVRDSQLDTILSTINTAIIADRTLGGIVDYVEAQTPDISTEHDDGVVVKIAVVPIMIRYVTTNPLT